MRRFLSRSMFIFLTITVLASTSLVPLFAPAIGLPANLSSKADLSTNNCDLLSKGIGNEDGIIHTQKFDDPRFLPYLEPKMISFEEDGHTLCGVCVDSEYLYTTGCSRWEGFGIHNLLLFKYSLNGDLIWNASVIHSDIILTVGGVDVCVDSGGSIYVLGKIISFNGLGYWDFFLCRYSSGGVQLWNKTFGTEYDDLAKGLCIDESEGIYVVGEKRYNETIDYDFFSLYKYSFTGSQIWNLTLGEEGNACLSSAVAIDSEGYIITSGSRFHSDALTLSGTIIKFSPNGEFVWERKIEGDHTFDIAIDSEDNICVTGNAGLGNRNLDVSLSKYSSEGEQLWNKTFGEEGKDYHLRSVSFDPEGNIFLAGYRDPLAGYGDDKELLICKFSSEGSYYWQKIFAGKKYCSGNAIAVDSDGNFYVVGPVGGSSNPSWTGNILLFMFQDSDNDGLSNQWEEEHGLDPYNPDCDGDGFTDGEELLKGTNPLKHQSNPQRRRSVIIITISSFLGVLLIISLSLFLVWGISNIQKRKIASIYSPKREELEAVIDSLKTLQADSSKGVIDFKEASERVEALRLKSTILDRTLHFPFLLEKRVEAKKLKEKLNQKWFSLEDELKKTEKLISELTEQISSFEEKLEDYNQRLSELSNKLDFKIIKNGEKVSRTSGQFLSVLLDEVNMIYIDLKHLSLPSSFLVSLDKGTLHKEFQSLYESYLSLHRKCKELLATIQSKIDNEC